MDDTPKSWVERILELPPIYYYSALGGIGIVILIASYWGNDDGSSIDTKVDPSVANLVDSPESAHKSVDALAELVKAASIDELVDSKMSSAFADLERCFLDVSLGRAPTTPSWVQSVFVGTGVDDENVIRRFDDTNIEVQRWQTSDSAPVFEGSDGFSQLVQNLANPFVGTKDYRIQLKAYSSEQLESGKLSIRIVAESYGVVEQDYGAISQSGFASKASQSTSLWETTWELNVVDGQEEAEYQLCDCKALAEERVTALLNTRQLLSDCTESILSGTEAAKQFQFGMDQWARSVPGIDISGNQGLAIGDANGDGLEDIYVCQAHGLRNRLLIQRSNGTAEDASERSRTDILDQTRSALFIDIDNDGDQDLVVATDETLVLMSNDGRGVFQIERSIAVGRNAQSISAADYDSDGDLDLFICKFEDINRQTDVLLFPTDLNKAVDGGRNVLLRNEEGYEFRDVTDVTGMMVDNSRYSRSAVWYDHDRDGDVDLYVANEFSSDQLFENQDGYFTDVANQLGIDEVARHKSVSVGDFNRDGWEDLFVATDVPLAGYRVLSGLKEEAAVINGSPAQSRIAVNRQMLTESQIRYNLGDSKFQGYFLRSPIFNGESAQSSAAVDLNNDGLDDLLVTNGGLSRIAKQDLNELFYSQAFAPPDRSLWNTANEPLRSQQFQVARTAHEISDLCRSGYSLAGGQRNRCYINIGTGFANFSAISGFDMPDDARGVAVVDWDQDGDLDIVTTCRTAPQLRIFCNQLNAKNSSVAFVLEGTKSNRDAIGGRVELMLVGQAEPLVKTVRAGSGNLSQSSKRLVFGLPKGSKIEMAKVHWPSGLIQSFKNLSAGAQYEMLESREGLAERVSDRFGLEIRPKELVAKIAVPTPDKRSLFYPRAPITTLQAQVAAGKWGEIKPNGKPMLVFFWSRNAQSDEWMRTLNEAYGRLSDAGVDCVALFVEDKTSPADQWLYAKQTVKSIDFDGKWGTLAPSSVIKMEYFFGDWFSHRQTPECPFGLLIGADQRVCAKYTLNSFSVEQFLSDVALSKQMDLQYRQAANSRRGLWVANARETKINRLRIRFKELGYETAAEELNGFSSKQRAHELTQKAIELGAQSDFAKAQVLFRQAISLDNKCIGAYIGEAQLLARVSKSQSNEDAVRSQMQVDAIERFETALTINPVSIDAIIGRAKVAMDQGRREVALEQLLEFLEISPERYEVHAIVGRLLFQEKRYDEAAQHLVQAFDNRPNLPFLAGDLGYLYLVSKEDKFARKFLRLANRLQPSDRNILRLLAEAEFVTGNFEEAVRLFTEVNRLDPTRRRAKNVLAWLLATCPYESRRDGEAAMKIISPMVELFGDTSPSTLEIYAACFAENGDFEKAVEFQQKAIQLFDEKKASEAYSEEQKQGMMTRVELYRRNRPYRTADIMQIPIPRPKRLD